MIRARNSATWIGLGVAVALMCAAVASSDSIDRYGTEYRRICTEQGTDPRVCACAMDQIANERGRPAIPAVDAAPPTLEGSMQVTGTRYAGYVAMCTRSARALGLLEN